MKYLKKLVLIVILLIPMTVKGEEYYTIDNNANPKETYNHSYFVFGSEVKDETSINGISFILGNNVLLKGTYEYGFIVGNDVNVSGNYEKDLFIAGNNVTLESGIKIGRDLYAAANKLIINADIYGNAFISADEITLENIIISGNLKLDCNTLNIKENTTITGTLEYDEDTIVTGLEKAHIGSVIKNEVIQKENSDYNYNNSFTFYSIISLLIIAYLINAINPKIYEKIIKKEDSKETLLNILYGFIVLIMVPLGSIIAFITLIGIPLSIISLLLYCVLIYLSSIITSIYFGNLLIKTVFKKELNSYLTILIGLVLLKLLELIPYLGGWISFASILFGIGLIFNLLFIKNNHKKINN